MKLSDFATVERLRQRLETIDIDLEHVQRAPMVTISLPTGSRHEIELDLLLPYLRAKRMEIVLDLASYGVSVG